VGRNVNERKISEVIKRIRTEINSKKESGVGDREIT
jgi:hypothetical protein